MVDGERRRSEALANGEDPDGMRPRSTCWRCWRSSRRASVLKRSSNAWTRQHALFHRLVPLGGAGKRTEWMRAIRHGIAGGLASHDVLADRAARHGVKVYARRRTVSPLPRTVRRRFKVGPGTASRVRRSVAPQGDKGRGRAWLFFGHR